MKIINAQWLTVEQYELFIGENISSSHQEDFGVTLAHYCAFSQTRRATGQCRCASIFTDIRKVRFCACIRDALCIIDNLLWAPNNLNSFQAEQLSPPSHCTVWLCVKNAHLSWLWTFRSTFLSVITQPFPRLVNTFYSGLSVFLVTKFQAAKNNVGRHWEKYLRRVWLSTILSSRPLRNQSSGHKEDTAVGKWARGVCSLLYLVPSFQGPKAATPSPACMTCCLPRTTTKPLLV